MPYRREEAGSLYFGHFSGVDAKKNLFKNHFKSGLKHFKPFEIKLNLFLLKNSF